MQDMLQTSSWVDDLYPDGRLLWYEGDDPDGFAAEMMTRFGLDVTAPIPDFMRDEFHHNFPWGTVLADEDGSEPLSFYEFYCPPELLDNIYGDDVPWPIGT